MINVVDKRQCVSCTSCFNKCPTNAIELLVDSEGFKYPSIDNKKCINCGICDQHCPILKKKVDKLNYDTEIYAANNINIEDRLDSTSGGIFTLFAEHFFDQNGYVCAAIYNDKWLVEHYISNNINDLVKMRSSKYLQSDLGKCFCKIEELLKQNNKVLFCGSPCQVSGLKCYLNKDYENLLTIDFICRGMNSPKIFEKFICELEDIYKSKVVNVKFKNKTYGWNLFSTKIEFENGKQYIKNRYRDSYMVGYLKYNAFMRPSCYDCKFKGINRASDITLADFWGIEKIDIDFSDDKGTSMVIVNSLKGKSIFNLITKKMKYKRIESTQTFLNNVCMNESPQETLNRKNVFENIDKYKYSELEKRFFPPNTILELAKIYIRRNIFNKLKIVVKKIRGKNDR